MANANYNCHTKTGSVLAFLAGTSFSASSVSIAASLQPKTKKWNNPFTVITAWCAKGWETHHRFILINKYTTCQPEPALEVTLLQKFNDQ